MVPIVGFGWFDACEYEPQEDSTVWIIEGVLPKCSFGFIAGPPKGNASPHGGKSVLNRKMALCTISGQPFFGHAITEQGRVMFVNLDEDQEKQVRLYYRMTKGAKLPGYLISRARSCRLPEQIKMLEEDIRTARPLIVTIDPLQRVLSGREVKEQSHVGPIIDELKRLVRTYECTIIVNHHSNKNPERDKENTASWLNGSTDLDAAWDFALCVEYEATSHAVHIRNFQKEKARTDIYYEAEIINKDEIIDLHHVPAELGKSKQAREILKALNKLGGSRPKSVQSLCDEIGVPRTTFYHTVQKYNVLKTAIGQLGLSSDGKGS